MFKDYRKRRERLIKTMPQGSALILPAGPESLRSGDVHWPYRPSSHLIYLSGFEEPDSCLVLLSPSKHILFVQPKDPNKALWTGPVYGPQKAGEVFLMDNTYPSYEFVQKALDIFKNTHTFYYDFGVNPTWDQKMDQVIQALKGQKKVSPSVHDPHLLITPFRMFKTKAEIDNTKKAIAISASAFKTVMQETRPGKNERELYALWLYEILKRGAKAEGYPGIFAGGANACTLHYTRNSSPLKEGQMLLVDAGAEYRYYSADITRTFPVNGRFSKTQKRIYNKLLKAQKTLIQLLKPGVGFKEIQSKAAQLLSLIMIEEGWLSNPLKTVIETKEYKQYFPHSFGHSLGLDVHDVTLSSSYGGGGEDHLPGGDVVLKEGFLLTMEPGLYLKPQDLSLPEEIRGLGLRIEDDILITQKGAEVLSQAVPKEPEELEELINT